MLCLILFLSLVYLVYFLGIRGVSLFVMMLKAGTKENLGWLIINKM